jgi:hypothetical protein
MSVYFIRGVGMRGPIKIGHSYSPARRALAHEASSPVKLEIVAEITGSFDLERRFHAAFIGSHERCEWFSWTPELQRTIDAINGGTFDPSSLPPPAYLPRRKHEDAKVRRLSGKRRPQLASDGGNDPRLVDAMHNHGERL